MKTKYNTCLTIEQFEENLIALLGHELGLNKRQAQDVLKGSEDIIAANWWNNIGEMETMLEIRSKELIEE
jgi:hypothetical protein